MVHLVIYKERIDFKTHVMDNIKTKAKIKKN